MVQVRWAHRGEAPKVFPLFRDLVTGEGAEPPSPAAFSRTWGRSFRDGSGFRFVVAEGPERRVLGCMSLHSHFSTWRGSPVVSLEDFFVLPEERGKGVGAAMLQFADAYAAELRAARITLHVLRTNDGAQRLYQRAGFEEVPYAYYQKHLPGLPQPTLHGAERRLAERRRREGREAPGAEAGAAEAGAEGAPEGEAAAPARRSLRDAARRAAQSRHGGAQGAEGGAPRAPRSGRGGRPFRPGGSRAEGRGPRDAGPGAGADRRQGRGGPRSGGGARGAGGPRRGPRRGGSKP